MGRIGITELIVIFVIMIPFILIPILSYWKLYEKAGKPGWASIIPIYSTIIKLQIINKPVYWLFLMFIPLLGLIWSIWTLNLFVKSYGKDEGYTIGCLFLPFIFLPMLAFNKSNHFIKATAETDKFYK